MLCSGARKTKRKIVLLQILNAIKACPRTTIYILGVNIPRWKKTVLVANWPPYREGKEKLRQEADRSRSVDGSFQKQENLWMRFVLGGQKINRNPQPAARILEVSTKLLAKFHHTSSPYGSTTHYCLKTVNLKTAPSMGTMGRTYIPKTKVGVRTLKMPGSSSQAILWSHTLHDFLQDPVKQ